ncbi:WD domain, G-beta repeat protein [Ancylostoma duodenale]|uniref:WD repeat-containing protein 89 n=1 Tax=Ancylostoma duodenale TaxID=51022 RepID=A0A0C2GAQ3_9BILA|nr:WD domain, G-beta repeat protein [Ancylostoma duodenale]
MVPLVLRAVDDSFGIHLFDIRAGSKKKSRVNPIMENHQVVCSACSDHYIALGSSTFVLESEEKKKSKKEETSDDDEEEEENENEAEIDPSQTPHVISVFDLRKCTDPVLTIKESHSDSINTLAFMRDGQHLISGGSDGLLNIFNASYGKEDQALQIFVPNSPDDVDYLFIFHVHIYDYDFRRNGVEGRFLVDALKGGVDERPVALLECDPEGTLYVRTVSKDGKNSEVVMEWKGHTDIVRSAAYNNRLLVTGGEDGKIVVKNVDLRPEGGKAEKRKDKQDDEKNNSKHKDKKEKKKERKAGEPY